MRAGLKNAFVLVSPSMTTAEMMMRESREVSFLAYRDDARRVADLRSLRHRFITQTVGGGVSAKVAHELARHSSPVLTIGRYSLS